MLAFLNFRGLARNLSNLPFYMQTIQLRGFCCAIVCYQNYRNYRNKHRHYVRIWLSVLILLYLINLTRRYHQSDGEHAFYVLALVRECERHVMFCETCNINKSDSTYPEIAFTSIIFISTAFSIGRMNALQLSS